MTPTIPPVVEPAADPTAPAAVIGLTLVAAPSGKELMAIVSGSVINLADLPSRDLNMRAEVTGAVKEVRFQLDAIRRFRVELSPPYSLAGKTGSRFQRWTPKLGAHRVVVTPATMLGGRLTEGLPYEATFTVIDERAKRLPGLADRGKENPPSSSNDPRASLDSTSKLENSRPVDSSLGVFGWPVPMPTPQGGSSSSRSSLEDKLSRIPPSLETQWRSEARSMRRERVRRRLERVRQRLMEKAREREEELTL